MGKPQKKGGKVDKKADHYDCYSCGYQESNEQLENNLITPKVMGKSTGLNPLIVLVAIMIGAKLGGVLGALLGVPVALSIAVYIETLIGDKKNRDNSFAIVCMSGNAA